MPLMSELQLTFACPPYDRILPLVDGRVRPEGIALNYLPLSPEEIFWRQLRHEEFDFSECSLSSYTMLRSQGDERFIALPAFTSRMFRHACVFINTHKGITSPEDLRGKIIGVPEYQMTAAVWLRGILQDEYGVFPNEISWRSGGQETPGRVEKIGLHLPADIRLEPVPPHKMLSEMLDEGELDALFTPREPSCFLRGSPNVGRLFGAFREVEEQYYRKTKIFPIMHTVVIKRRIYRNHPWVAMSLYKAFCEAKTHAVRSYSDMGVVYVTLPWIKLEMEHTKNLMGEDWWPYGIDRNRGALETFLRYHYQQGLSGKQMTIEDLFAPETLDEHKV